MPLITRPQVYRAVREMLPRTGSGRMSCCAGWRMSNSATKGRDALMKNAAPPADHG